MENVFRTLFWYNKGMASRQRLQALFDEFNSGGSTVVMHDDGPDPSRMFVQDSYTVTRVDGEVFWLMFRPVGYQDDWHHTHTIKVLSWSQADGYELDLFDDLGRRFHVELIFSELDPGPAETWAKWKAYRRRNRKMFAEVDATLLDRHMRLAEDW